MSNNRPSDTSPSRYHPFRILIADPHPLMRRGYLALMEMEPALVICGEASSMEEALGLLSRSSIDLLITSVHLEASSGLDLVRAARALYPRLRILVVSHQDAGYFTPNVLDAGGDAYLERTEVIDLGLEVIRELLCNAAEERS